jgi:hypothetical protein
MATENIVVGAEGFVTSQGLVRKLNTLFDSEGNALAEGDLLFLSASVLGGYTRIEPQTPNFHVFLGYVVRVSATVGSIFVRPNVYPSVDDINGISIVSTASGNTFIYDAVAGYYKTATLTAGSGITITNGAGSITIDATGGGGTVTSVSGTGTVNGITLTGTVTTSGSLTLGGTLSGVSLTTQVSGTLPVGNGGTGITSFGTGVATFLGTPSSANLAAAVTDETGTGALVFATSPALVTPVLGTPTSGTLSNCTVDGTTSVGFRTIPQNSQSANYTLVLDDSGRHIFHPVADNNARTFTIPANSSVAFPVGTAVTFINMSVASVTIAITTDTLTLSPAGTSGSRTLATNGSATCIKITSTQWLISGSGLT